ncbi:hypothetical protein K2173_024925 [Erythroxylum novogranatense]|uniref:Ubiquitin carboxyl-terminal hydrolase n=1 Tax=Erythroxylum novogranatense TaxID=1862640 RepID=A0AAV8UCS0_9ROSI|nr:hypothetical protein K2173_024925 [Erythroxylum novogranatense]
MSDSKQVLVFGSFTEDETKSLLKKQSSSNDKKAEEKKALRFGSLSVATGITFGNFDCELSGKLSSGNEPISFQTTNPFENEKGVKIVKIADDVPRVLGSPKVNERIYSKPSTFPLSNGVKDLKPESIGLNDLHLCKNDGGPANQYASSNFNELDSREVKGSDQNGSIQDYSVHRTIEDIKVSANGSVISVRNFLPRGLVNSGNLCFLNATVQALLSCSPFVQLLQKVRVQNLPKVGFPTLTAFTEFLADFEMPSSSIMKKDTTVVETGRPVTPTMFEAVLKNFTPDVPESVSGRPRQEDAQEFLSFIMDRMHEELLKLEGQSTGANGAKSLLISSTEDDEWETVGPKNTSAVTRTQSFIPSGLSDIFGGQIKSVVKARGNKASATVQPYLLLHLDIYPEVVRSIEDALRLFSASEDLEGYHTSNSGKAGVVSARKSVKIQTLSKIMILHLMRFCYGTQGSAKLHKPVHFPLELMLGRELLVYPSTEGRKYELVATITHHGRDPSKGHYTADARYPNGLWLRFDDVSVTPIGMNKVLHDQAYVLFYKQM